MRNIVLPNPDEKLKQRLAELAEKYRTSPYATVVDRLDLTEDLIRLWLRPWNTNIPQFIPGQFCQLYIEEAHARAFSIASTPHDSFFEFFIELIPEEKWEADSLTPRIWQIALGQAGIKVLAAGSKIGVAGDLTLDTNYSRHIMVATVTGIAPFMSILRAQENGYYGNAGKSLAFYVFHGASYQDEFGYDAELEEMTRKGLIVYEKTVSQVPGKEKELGRNSGWVGNVGRVNDIFFDLTKIHGLDPDENTMVYLCGNEMMISDLANDKPRPGRFEPDDPRSRLGKLLENGYSASQIKTEKFY